MKNILLLLCVYVCIEKDKFNGINVQQTKELKRSPSRDNFKRITSHGRNLYALLLLFFSLSIIIEEILQHHESRTTGGQEDRLN